MYTWFVAGALAQSDPNPIRRIEPGYPETDVDWAHCRVDFQVDEDGRPSRVMIAGCSEPFQSAAQDAAEKWRFQPATDHHPDYSEAQIEDALRVIYLGESMFRQVWPGRSLVSP
ncbi:MAG: TonB family protein [Myxococcota bacterium]|jgi:TonB family protein